MGVLRTLRSPEMLAPARMPVAEGKKMENIPKKLPSAPRQSGTKFWTKMSPGKPRRASGPPGRLGPSQAPGGQGLRRQLLATEWGVLCSRGTQNGPDGWAERPVPMGRGSDLHVPR